MGFGSFHPGRVRASDAQPAPIAFPALLLLLSVLHPIAYGRSGSADGSSDRHRIDTAAGKAASPAPETAWPRDLPSLIDQDGRRFSFSGLASNTVLVNFIFTTCPAQCPAQMQRLIGLRRALPQELRSRVRFVSVTVDPDRDSAAVLKRYAEAMGADSADWSFVTGTAPDLQRLYKYFGAGVRLLDDGLFDHQVGVYLLDRRGRVMQRYTGEIGASRMLREIAAVDAMGR